MRALVAALVASGLVLASAPARADVQSCIAASEKGQRARSNGKLREARDAFQACGADACPAMVRKDCVQWQSDLTQVIPTVVFGAKDAKGRDLFDVTVSMDGEMIVNKLDGKSIPVDPGPHTFKFDVAGLPSVVEKALVKEGEKSRVMTVSFGGDSGGTGQPPPPPPNPDRVDHGGGHTAFPWIVVGLGGATIIAGAVVLLTSPALPPNCNAGNKVCQKTAGETNEQFAQDQDQAGKHDSQPVVGGVVMGIGGVLVLGGLVWHFLEPSASDTKTGFVRVTPWTTTSSAGVSLGGAF